MGRAARSRTAFEEYAKRQEMAFEQIDASREAPIHETQTVVEWHSISYELLI